MFSDGKVTPYDINYDQSNSDSQELTFGDLNGLSDDGVIDKVRSICDNNFEASKADKIADANDAIDVTQAEIDELTAGEEELRSQYSGTEDVESIIAEEIAPHKEELQQEVDFYESYISAVEAQEYAEPEAVSYSLAITTDDSGNNADDETISFTHSELLTADYEDYLDTYGSTTIDSVLVEDDEDVTFDVGTDAQTIYDTQFGGYDDLYTKVTDSVGYVLDTPDTEGVEVD